jgi:hypothetical protein
MQRELSYPTPDSDRNDKGFYENAIQLGNAKIRGFVTVFSSIFSHSHDAVIRVYDTARNVIDTHKHKGDFKRPRSIALISLRSLARGEAELRDLIAAVRA